MWGTALALSIVGCADLLDLPSNPRLEEPATEPVGSDPGSESRGEPSSSPEPLLSGAAGNASSTNTPGAVNAGGGTTPQDDREPATPADGTAAAGDATASLDAGALPTPDAGATPPEPEPEQPEQPALGGCVPPESVGPNGRCFLVVETLLAWDDARSNCQARGDDWDLAAIHNLADNTFIGGLTDEEAWIGGSDATTEGTWLWVSDGQPFWSGDGTTGNALNGAFEAWNSDEPNGRGNSDCARTVPIIRTGDGLTWADLECFELRASLCEGPPL